MTAVLGPGASGVVVATPDQEEARRDRVWLEDAHIAAAMPIDVGLKVRKASVRVRAKDDPRRFLPLAWVRAARRPAIATFGEEVFVADREQGVWADRGEAFEVIEGALGETVPPRVAVFGGAWTVEDEPDYGSARTFGRGMAEEGLEIVCGGYQGIMAAVCRGARDTASGLTVGVTVAPWSARVPVNDWVDHVVEARDLFARLPLISDAEAWVAFPGGVGTLKEVALCWNLVQNGLVEPRPLIVVGERWGRLLDTFREALILTEPAHLNLLRHVDTAEEALVLVRKDLA